MGIIIFLFIVIVLFFVNKNNRKLKRLKENYEAALNGSDKRIALDAGRAYYSALRGDRILTIYDEQAITNDLMAMKTGNGERQNNPSDRTTNKGFDIGQFRKN